MPVKTKKKTPRPKSKEKKEALEVITPKRIDKDYTIKQQLFVKEYLIDFNAKRAAEAAGYSKKTAYSIAGENLNKPEVQQQIRAEVEKMFAGKDLEKEKIVEHIGKVAFADIKNFLSFNETGVTFKNSDEVDGTMIQSVKSVTTEFTNKDGEVTKKTTMELKLWDKMKALEMLGKYKALFNDINVNNIVNVNEVKTVIVEVIKNERANAD